MDGILQFTRERFEKTDAASAASACIRRGRTSFSADAGRFLEAAGAMFLNELPKVSLKNLQVLVLHTEHTEHLDCKTTIVLKP